MPSWLGSGKIVSLETDLVKEQNALGIFHHDFFPKYFPGKNNLVFSDVDNLVGSW